MRRMLLTGLLLITVPTLSPAQTGTQVWSIKVDMTEGPLASQTGLKEVELRATIARGPDSYAFQIQAGPSLVSAFPMFDLSAVRLVAVLPERGDSFHVGVVLPPEMAAQIGGGIGYRLDGEIPDSLPLPMNIDSVIAAQESGDSLATQWTNSGRTATVAGISCEEWIATVRVPSAADTTSLRIEMCLAPPLAIATGLTEWLKQHLPQLMSNYDALRAKGLAQFGGRDLSPIRMRLVGGIETTIELVSQSAAAPDASYFVLPEGLAPFPVEMLQGMIPKSPTK